jgi:hypothetical protein
VPATARRLWCGRTYRSATAAPPPPARLPCTQDLLALGRACVGGGPSRRRQQYQGTHAPPPPRGRSQWLPSTILTSFVGSLVDRVGGRRKLSSCRGPGF